MKKFNFKIILNDKRCYNYSCYSKNDIQALAKVKKIYGHNIKSIEQEIGGKWLSVY